MTVTIDPPVADPADRLLPGGPLGDRLLGGIVDALEGALSRAAEVPLGDLPGPAAAVAAVRLVAAQRQLEALQSRVLARVDACGEWEAEGFRSPATWLAARTTVGLPAARASARLADRLARFPALAASFVAGRVGAEHLAVLADAHRFYPRLAGPLTAIEPEIAAYAEQVDAATLRAFLAGRLHQIDPDAADDAEAARRRRESYLTAREVGDGWVKVDGVLPPEVGLAFTAALDAAVRDLPSGGDEAGAEAGSRGRSGAAPEPVPEPVPEPAPVAAALRPRRIRNVEGLLRVLGAAASATDSQRLPDVRGQRPVVAVTVPVEVLAGVAAECGRPLPAGIPGSGRIGAGVATADAAAVSAETVRRLACDAELRRLVVDPAGLVLDVSRTTRTVSPQLRLAVEHRDGGRCRFPGCRSRIDEAHHVVHWSRGGETSRANTLGLCWFHHHEVHHSGWELSGSADGEISFRRQGRGPTFVSRPAASRPRPPGGPPPGSPPSAARRR